MFTALNRLKSFRLENPSKMSTKRPSSTQTEAKKLKTSGHWSLGLLHAMHDPDSVVDSCTDDHIITIKDKYPKAEFHYLVMPQENISSIKSITSEHQSLLEYMEEAGERLARDDRHKGRKFKLGYHSEASMLRLHLHVISDDMNSPCLKTKKHWNSFNTEFFLDSKDVRKQLKKTGKIVLPTKETCKKWLMAALKCHKCDYSPKSMPDLKRHILNHLNLK